MRQKSLKLGMNLILLVCSVITVIPFVWMLSSSFKSNIEINSMVQTFFPIEATLDNYQNALQKFNFFKYFGNSLFYAIAITVLTIYTSTLAGFVLSKYKFRGRNLLFNAILMTMMVPGVVTIIPRYSMMEMFGWLDSYKALIIPSMFSSFGIFMMRQACSGIPDELLEAARIDGASEFYIFHRIVFPLCGNAVTSIAIFQFLWAWEDYLWPYLMIRTEEKQMLSVALNMFNGRHSTDYASLFAATSIAIIPVVIVYLIFQKRFIEGISSSAVKG